MIEFLRTQNISSKLIDDILYFRNFYRLDERWEHRVPKPKYHYYGKDVWEMAITAILQGDNILLSGPKATGKNVLADDLAATFHRPSWNVSFHVNTDSSTLIGTDTFTDGEVHFRKGSIYEAAIYGGFGIFDEINMAKNDAIAVLHSALDHRRIIDVSGYDRIELAEETRFIGTMNYGYAGTKELNEALVSRFMVIDIPPVDREKLKMILASEFSDLREEYLENFSSLFLDLQLKSRNSEISSKAVDLRGLIGAVKAMDRGLDPFAAIRMGILGKIFDDFEKEIVEDVVKLHLPRKATREDIFR
ncbi:MAG: AAA family ATPase [Peptostreptococcaceae bacterium]|nr:AAA family ATPase [Peptostreptococcaceae bacterium]